MLLPSKNKVVDEKKLVQSGKEVKITNMILQRLQVLCRFDFEIVVA